MDKAVVGGCRVGYFRVGVRNSLWADLLKQYGDYDSTTSSYRLAVTRRRLQLDSPADSITGLYSRSFPESSADMLIYDRSTQSQMLSLGVYVKNDAVGITCDSFLEGDEVRTRQGLTYEVKTVMPHYMGNDFCFYSYDLTLLPMTGLETVAYEAVSTDDARYRTKLYLDTYLDKDKLPNYLTCFAYPNYPVTRVLKEKQKNFVFIIHNPASRPTSKGDLSISGYDEQLPIEINTVDKGTVLGETLMQQAVSELRRLTETWITGSQRQIDVEQGKPKILGSTTLYSTTVTLNYWRDTS